MTLSARSSLAGYSLVRGPFQAPRACAHGNDQFVNSPWKSIMGWTFRRASAPHLYGGVNEDIEDHGALGYFSRAAMPVCRGLITIG